MAAELMNAQVDATTLDEAEVPYREGMCIAALEPAVVEALRTVFDPEIPVSIFDLGLVYALKIDDAQGVVRILMTLTTPSCPVAGEIPRWVQAAVSQIPEVSRVEVALVWDPPWCPEFMSEDSRLMLNLF